MGRFKRIHDDYASPFDVDASDSYIDPSVTIEREAQIEAKRHRRKAADAAQRDIRLQQLKQRRRYDDAASRQAQSPAVNSHRAAAHRARVSQKRKARNPKHAITVAAVVLALAISIYAAGAAGIRLWTDHSSDHAILLPPVYSSQDSVPVEYERSGELTPLYAKTPMDVTISGAYAGIHANDTNARTVVIKLEVTNNATSEMSLAAVGEITVYQNGVELPDTYLVPERGVLPEYGMLDYDDIDAGATAIVSKPFELRDDAEPLDVRISGNYDSATIRSAFNIGQDVPASPFEQIDSSQLPATPKAIAAADMTEIHDPYSDEYMADARIDSIVRGPRTYDGIDTVIVTYTWINRTDSPISLEWLGSISAYFNGEEVDTRYVSADAVEGFENSSEFIEVLPDIEFTVTVAYGIPEYAGEFRACFEDYNDDVLIERTVDLR